MLAMFKILPSYPAPLPLTNEAWPIVTILVVYMIFVLKVGRIFMKNRPPYKLQNALAVYNLGQVAYNAVVCSVAFYYLFIEPLYDLSCMETFPADHKYKDLERHLHYAFYANKIFDLTDTVFFLLRKSYKQISFLHVYHHVMVISCTYIILRFYGTGGLLTAVTMINSFVHAVMYFYYFMSSRYPDVSIRWKKYITLIQLIQFAVIFSHSAYVMLFSKGCGFPHSLLWLNIVQTSVLMYMFGKFYAKTYIRASKGQQEKVKQG